MLVGMLSVQMVSTPEIVIKLYGIRECNGGRQMGYHEFNHIFIAAIVFHCASCGISNAIFLFVQSLVVVTHVEQRTPKLVTDKSLQLSQFRNWIRNCLRCHQQRSLAQAAWLQQRCLASESEMGWRMDPLINVAFAIVWPTLTLQVTWAEYSASKTPYSVVALLDCATAKGKNHPVIFAWNTFKVLFYCSSPQDRFWRWS